MGKPEGKVEDYLREQVPLHGGMVEKHTSPGRRGVPDDLVTWFGGMDLVECKAKNGIVKAHQLRDHKARALLGVPVYLLDTKERVDLYVARRSLGMHPSSLWSVRLS
jgi:hypothetical protein